MAQHDYNIANDTAANVRADINNVLEAIVSNNSGASEPSTTYANQWWYDSANNILKIRNEVDTAWIDVGTLNQVDSKFEVSTAGIPYGMEPLAVSVASNDATIEFTDFDSTKYDAYKIVLTNVIPATNNVTLSLRTSADGGSTYDSGSSDYSYACGQAGTGNDNASTTQSSILLTKTSANNVGSAAGEGGVSGEVVISGPHLIKHTQTSAALCYRNSVGNLIPTVSVGARNAEEAVDAVQILFSSGNIESGTITLYGMRSA